MNHNSFEEFIKPFSHIQSCSFDAGGGNVLAHLIKNFKISTSFLIDGPSLGIYSELFPQFFPLNTKSLNSETDLLISSTGWQSNHEFDFMQEALLKGIPVVAVIDHWVEYVERFERSGKRISPTIYLALDDFAERKLIQELKNPIIFRSENFYIKKILKEIADLRKSSTGSTYDFVFIAEPLIRSIENSGWNEYDAIKHFFNVLRDLDLKNSRIAIKPHPSEYSGKYSESIPNDFESVKIDTDYSLSRILSESDSVVGCHSMALYIAELSGNKVYTALPPGIISKVPLKKAKPIFSLIEF